MRRVAAEISWNLGLDERRRRRGWCGRGRCIAGLATKVISVGSGVFNAFDAGNFEVWVAAEFRAQPLANSPSFIEEIVTERGGWDYARRCH